MPKIKPIGIVDLVGGLLLVIAVLVSPSASGDPGVGWHLKTGEWISEQREVPQFDPFLLEDQLRPWVHNQWLSDLVLYQVFRLGGWPLLHALVLVVLVVLYFLVLAPFLKSCKISPLVAMLTLAAALLENSVQWFLRPVIFSFLFFALSYVCVYRFYQRAQRGEASLRPLLLLPPLFLVWANLHPAFVLGIGLLGALVAALVIEYASGKSSVTKKAIALAGFALPICALAPLLNPYGLGLYQDILALAGSEYFMNLNVEWLSTDFHIGLFMPFFVVLFVLIFLSARLETKPLLFLDCVLVVVFFALALLQRRYIPFFAIVSALPLARLIEAWFAAAVPKHGFWQRMRTGIQDITRRQARCSSGGLVMILCCLLIIVTAVAGHLPFRSSEDSALWGAFPHSAVEHLKEQNAQGAIFHTPDWGGFITWMRYPEQRAFMDDRNQLNGIERYETYRMVRMGGVGWRELVKKYDFRWLLLSPDAPLNLILEQDKFWKEVHRGENAILYFNATE